MLIHFGGLMFFSLNNFFKVTPGSPAARSLRANDDILAINNIPTANMTHKEAEKLIRQSGDQVVFTLRRQVCETGVVLFQ